MNPKVTTISLAAMLLACSASNADQTGGPLTPSELLANMERYDGKHVVIKGYIVIGPESRNIFDSKNGYGDPHGACLGLDGPNKMFSGFHQKYVTKISGVFRRSLCGTNDVCLFWCGNSGIELDAGSKP